MMDGADSFGGEKDSDSVGPDDRIVMLSSVGSAGALSSSMFVVSVVFISAETRAPANINANSSVKMVSNLSTEG